MILAHAARLGHSPWNWHPHPDVWALVLFLGGGYGLALHARRRATGQAPATRKEIGLFAGGLALVWVASDWPVHDVAEGYLYSMHMVQHTVLTLVAPPLLLLGTPAWLLRRLLGPVLPVFRLLVRPFVALVIFNATLAATHWTVLTNMAVLSGWSHFAQHVALVVTASLMWWPVVERLPELGRMHPAVKMVYLFLQSLVPTVPASFLTLSDTPIYRSYERFPKFWGLTTVTDQQVAGAIMKIGGAAILWVVIAVVFFRWFARENGAERRGTRRAAAGAEESPPAAAGDGRLHDAPATIAEQTETGRVP